MLWRQNYETQRRPFRCIGAALLDEYLSMPQALALSPPGHGRSPRALSRDATTGITFIADIHHQSFLLSVIFDDMALKKYFRYFC